MVASKQSTPNDYNSKATVKSSLAICYSVMVSLRKALWGSGVVVLGRVK